jgi:hypothetical protein
VAKYPRRLIFKCSKFVNKLESVNDVRALVRLKYYCLEKHFLPIPVRCGQYTHFATPLVLCDHIYKHLAVIYNRSRTLKQPDARGDEEFDAGE